MRIEVGLTILLAAFPEAAAASPRQFDLVCHGQSRTTAANIAPLERVDESRMSVDLGRRLWCWHKGATCAQALPIGESDEHQLKLGSAIGSRGDSRIQVDLSSGVYTSLIHVRVSGTPEITSTAAGHCTVVPFTPGIL